MSTDEMKIYVSQFRKNQRLDPEFYFSQASVFKKSIQLSSTADITVGKTPKKIISGDRPFYRVENIEKWDLKDPKIQLSKNALPEKFLAKKGDILMSTKGRVGDAALVEKVGYFNQDTARIIPKNIDPHLLLALLNSEFVQQQIKRLSTNQMHPYIRISELRKIKIPTPGQNLATKISKLAGDVLKHQAEITSLHQQVSSSFVPSGKISGNEITFEKIKNHHRIDADFFLTQDGPNLKKVRDLKNASIKIGVYQKIFTKNGIPYLRAKDIKNGKIISGLFVPRSIIYKATQPNEILLTRVGHVKAFCIKGEKVIPSDNFLRLRYENSHMPPHVLTTYFNSPPGQHEIERHMQGSKQKRLNKKSLQNVTLPHLNESKMRHTILNIAKIEKLEQQVHLMKKQINVATSAFL